MPADVRQLDSLDTFKQFLSRERERVPKLFYSGNRSFFILAYEQTAATWIMIFS